MMIIKILSICNNNCNMPVSRGLSFLMFLFRNISEFHPKALVEYIVNFLLNWTECPIKAHYEMLQSPLKWSQITCYKGIELSHCLVALNVGGACMSPLLLDKLWLTHNRSISQGFT